jgi:hypothetical protein
VYSYDSPVSPPQYYREGNKYFEEGYEFSAIDVEACASPNSGRQREPIYPRNFTLQMPDNTRLRLRIGARE